MHLDPTLIQFILVMIVSIIIARVALPLSTTGIRDSSHIYKVIVLALSTGVTLIWFITNPDQLAPRSSAISGIIPALSLVWGLTVLPTPALAPSLRSASEIHPTRSLKVIQLILCLVCFFVPSAFVPCFVLGYHLARQRFGYISTTEILLPHAISCVVVSYLCLSLVMPISDESLIIALCACTGAHYFPSGFKKLKTGWVQHNALYNIIVGASTQNRWNLIHPSKRLRSWIQSTAIPAQLTVVLIETLAIFAFVEFRVAAALFSALILMHAMIFLTTGIFFWKWIITLLGVLIAFGLSAHAPISALDALNTSSIIILACTLPFAFPTIPTLAWFDPPISRRVTFTLSNGTQQVSLNPYDIRPIDLLLSQGRHELYFKDAPSSFDCFGTTYDRSIHALLVSLSKDADLTLQEKSTRALAILEKPPLTSQNRWFINTETTRFLAQLKFNIQDRSVHHFPNFHIYNQLPRVSKELLACLMESDENDGLVMRVEREIYFYCTYSNQSIRIDQQSIDIQIINNQCVYQTNHAPDPTLDAAIAEKAT